MNYSRIRLGLLLFYFCNAIGNADAMPNALIEMQDKHIQTILQAGAHKTASTHLQNRLLQNEHLFAKTRCSYLGQERIRDEFGPLWQALGRSDSPAEQKIKLAVLAAGRSRLLISEENIICGFKDLMNGPNWAMIYPKALEHLTRLAQLAGAYRHGRAGTLLLLCICLQSIVAFRTVPNLGAFLKRVGSDCGEMV